MEFFKVANPKARKAIDSARVILDKNSVIFVYSVSPPHLSAAFDRLGVLLF